MRRLLALVSLLAGCQADPLQLGVILPRDAESTFDHVDCWRLTATRNGRELRDTATSPFDLHLRDMRPGTYDLTLEAVEGPSNDPLKDACSDGDVLARADTRDAQVDLDRTERVPLVVLPADQTVTLDVPSWVEDWFEGRRELVAVRTVDAAGVPRVVFAGGRTDDGPSAAVLLYEPRRAKFTVLPDLACTRAGAAAVAVGNPGEDERVLIAGGEGSCPPLAADAEPRDARDTAELFDPSNGASVAAPDLPLRAPSPRMLRDPDHRDQAWLIASLEETTGRDVHWNGVDWVQNGQGNAGLPRSGGAFTPIRPDGGAPFLTAGGYSSGVPVERVSLFEPETERRSLRACVVEQPTVSINGNDVVAVPTDDGEVLFAGNADDGGRRWYRQTFDRQECDASSEVTMGELAEARTAPVATRLDDGSVLLSGGDAEGTLEVYLSDPAGTLPLGGTAGHRADHVAVVLADGEAPAGWSWPVLVAGGGPRTVEAVLPRQSAQHRLEWDHNAEDTPPLEVIVIVSSHQEASDVRALLSGGGYFTPEGRLEHAGPEGLADATEPLTAEFELSNDEEIHIVVATGDMRCVGRDDGDGGQPRECTDPDHRDNKAEELECVLDEIHEEGACVAQELLRALQETIALGDPRHDRPLLVLVAAPRDDCSGAEGNEALFADSERLLERCATDEGLLDPAAVASALRALRNDDGSISVMTFGGPEVAETSVLDEACPGIYPTPRIAALSRAMGGHHVNLCESGPREDGPSSKTALDWWYDLVNSRIGRSVCLPHRPVAAGASCVVTYERPGDPEIHRIPAASSRDDGLGWSVQPAPADEVIPGTSCATGILSVPQEYPIPLGVAVSYACR